MTRTLRLGFLSGWNPYERTNLSGNIFYMRRALEQHPQVTELRVLGGHKKPLPRPVERILRKMPKTWRARQLPRIARNQIDDTDLDAIVAPFSTGLVGDFALDLAPPSIILTDATPGFLREFYNLPIPDDAEAQEARGLGKARLVVYSSQFMVDRALLDFDHLIPEHLHAIAFGLNLDTRPPRPGPKPAMTPLRLIHIGKDWQQKGGDRAVAILDRLRDAGVDAHLTMIGATGPGVEGHPHITHLGFLNKGIPAQAARYAAALRDAHLFILPTRADCTPMVVAEANAHGCPVLISQIGGIATLMDDDRNGRMLPAKAGPDDWADAIQDLTRNRAAYDRLSQSSYAHCMERLTWEAWSDSLTALIRKTLQEDAA